MNFSENNKISKKQKLAMIILGMTATLAQGARIQSMIHTNAGLIESAGVK
jgi:hypothetical protein